MLEKLAGMPSTIEEAAKEAGRYDDRGTYSSVDRRPTCPTTWRSWSACGAGSGCRAAVPGRWLDDDEPTVNGPRGLAVVGTKAYVAVYFSDNLAVVDLEPKPRKPVSTDRRWGPSRRLTVQRRGEMYFHDATLCFQHWQSCCELPSGRPGRRA